MKPTSTCQVTAFWFAFLVCFGSMNTAYAKVMLQSPRKVKSTNSTVQSGQDVRLLEVGKPIEREMKSGETHIYQLNLVAGQFLHALVDQRGIDVVVTLFGPDGKQIIEVDSPNGTQGPEPVWLIAGSSGDCRLQVRSLERKAKPGLYEVRIEEQRPATEADKNRVAAEHLFMQAQLLRAQGTKEFLQKSIRIYEESLPFRRVAGDHPGEANTLGFIGLIHNTMGENQKALEYFNQELAIWRELGNRAEEAGTLIAIGKAYADLGERGKALEYYNQALPIWQALGSLFGEALTLNAMGKACYDSGEIRKALEYHSLALPIRRTMGDRSGEAGTLINMGLAASALGQKQKALNYYDQGLSILRATEDRLGEASTLTAIAKVYTDIGEKQKALEHINQVLLIMRELRNRIGEATTLNNIGTIHSDLGEVPKAIEYFHQALPIQRQAKDRSGETYTLINLGVAHHRIGENQKALEYFDQALPIVQALGDRYGEANTLNNLGVIYSSLGEYRKALEYYSQALPIHRRIGDRAGEAHALSNIGQTYNDLGEQQKALDYYSQVLPIMQVMRDRTGEATMLNNLGGVYNDLGDKQKALAYYNQALPIRRQIEDRSGEAQTLTNIGGLYGDLGQNIKALEYFVQALEIQVSIRDLNGAASTINSVSVALDRLGKKEEALTFYRKALQINQEIGSRDGEAVTLSNIGDIYSSRGDKQGALKYYNQALQIQRTIGDQIGEASTLNSLGTVYSDLGEKQKALEYYNQALPIQRQVRDSWGKAQTLNNLGSLYEDLGDKQRALDLYQQAILTFEEIRTTATIEEIKIGLTEQSAFAYERATILLKDLRQDSQAFNLSERARARTFLDQMGNIRLHIRERAGAQFALEEQELTSELFLLEKRIKQENSKISPSLNAAAISSLTNELATKRRKYEDLLIRLKLANPEYASLRTVDTLSVSDVQKLLDEETTILSYFVADKKALVFIIRRHFFQAVEIPVEEAELKATTTWFRSFANLRDPKSQSLQQLYNWLIAPIKQYLKTPMIGIIPDGILHYLPFAALTDGRHLFGDEYTLFHLPSASVLPFIQKKKSVVGTQLLALAQSQAGGSPALQYAEGEAEAIANIYGTKAFTRGASSKADFLKRAGECNILHIAAHAELNTASPLFSRIMLGAEQEDTRTLEVREVYDLDLPKTSLVVLSACETQLGQQSKGDDIVALNRAFIYAGAPTVIASLWAVDDESTSYLMKSFYTHLKNGTSKAEALRFAQSDTRKKYPHPYYWAGFVLTGDPGQTTKK